MAEQTSEIVTENIRTTKQIAEAYPAIFNVGRLLWYAKNRDKNGLAERGVVFKGPGRSLLWDEEKLLRWRLGQ